MDNNYLYAGARIRVLENALVGQERLEKLLACESVDACAALLDEWNFGIVRNPETGVFDREATLTARLSDGYREVLSSADGVAFAKIWLLPYDCNNIKSAIKCLRRGLDCDRMLIRLYGGIPTETVRTAVEKREFGLLPEPFATAARDACGQLERTGDPRVVDSVLDRACYAGMLALAKESGVPLAEKLVVRRIDLTNAMIALRGCRMGGEVGRRTLGEFFLPGGKVGEPDLASWSEAGEETLHSRLHHTDCERFAKRAAETDGTAAALERAADDELMEVAREAKMVSFGAEILVGYLIAREYEVKNLRILLAGKSVGLTTDALRERMRLSYV